MLAAHVRPGVKEMPPLEGFVTIPIAVDVRFRKWDEILKMPKPDPAMKTETVFWHFARGMALAAKGKPDEAQADYDMMGELSFRGRLGAHDPAAAIRIAPGDRQRLVRAWEVFAATDTPLSDWQQSGAPALSPGAWRAVALEPPREALYARCDARLEAMVAAGVLDEVRALRARNLDPALPALKAVGMREFAAHLAGEMSLEDAVTAAQRETRRYAKRQTTWMRGRMADWPRLTEIDPEGQWRQFLALEPA